MSATLRFAAAVMVVGVALATQCCFPRQYQAMQGIMRTSYEGSKVSVLAGNIAYAFDGVSRREAFNESLIVDGQEVMVTVIKDYNVTKTKYVITASGCTKEPLDDFREGCIEDWETKLTDGYYGAPSTGSQFSVYNSSASTVTSFIVATQTLFDESCYPILDLSTSTTGSTPYMQAVMLYNFTLGIPDESVFNIPKICQTA